MVKVASTPFAKPGEEVDFTIRFDNIGNQPIGNVTILDSLSTRLEYVPQSAQCSVEAKFSTQPNEGEFGGGALRSVPSRSIPAKAASSASAAACDSNVFLTLRVRAPA